MKKLNKKQKTFADEYIMCGNAYQAAKAAGYTDNYARSSSYKLLENEDIQAYIESRTKKAEEKLTYEIEDVIKKVYEKALGIQYSRPFREVDMLTGEVSIDTIRFTIPTDKDQLMAADMLMRMSGRYVDKQQIEHLAAVKFVDDIEMEMLDEDE